MNWYRIVTENISRIADCIEFYEKELEDARSEVRLKGSLERASADIPGIVEYRFNQLQVIEAILESLNIDLRKLKSERFKKLLEHYNRALSSRDALVYVDGDIDVVDMMRIINEFSLLRNKFLGIIKGLDQKQWQITNITRLRVAGLEDATI